MTDNIRLRTLEDRILVYDITGPMSMAMLMDMGHVSQTANTAMQQKTSNWAAISVLHVSSRASEDVITTANQSILNLRDNKILSPICSVVIAPDVDGYGETEQLYAHLHAGTGNLFKIFESLAEALDWTRAQLQAMDKKANTINADD